MINHVCVRTHLENFSTVGLMFNLGWYNRDCSDFVVDGGTSRKLKCTVMRDGLINVRDCIITIYFVVR